MNYFEIIKSVLERWYEGLAQATPKIIVGVLVFMFFLTMSSYLSKISVRIFQKFFPKSKNSSIVTLIKAFKFLIILSGTFIALEIMGLGSFVLKFIGSLGVAGVVAGVALKDLVSSMFSGALVSIDKSFANGDYVSIKEVTGVVEKIGFLTTKIITDDGKKVFVPNQLIFSAPFTNYSSSGQRKIFLDLQVSGNQDLEKTREIILDEIKSFDFTDHIEESQVITIKQSSDIVYFQARFFMKSGENVTKVRSEALLKLREKLNESAIELASQNSVDSSSK
ncbi:mechanosensitive ion channel family protein [Kaistella sp.]|uniref:mechanosensitive ion channel family protein n=1 Tax=Kaistella sp. TaxID=2782235 RepID=UPI003C4039DE